MDCLLDTHTLIWVIIEKEKLSRIVKRNIEDPDNNILVSAISFWEIALESAIGKMKLLGILSEEFPELSLRMDFNLFRCP